ncbi:CpsD/CapB family tyrosine-protein kinase [Christensenella intestinihominis]|uniref:CpsD/CapB family tyrosine-protein kinase n=1 Tax=Christensenella intestinihominis TaxID=1851429 RepID=UPI00082BA4C4|nr:CpsD/CapB family tyrosine-protein kinase [Christensenella intestinihominis]
MDIDYKKQALEAFNTIQTNIGFLGIDRDIRTIMVTSSIKGEGKSTVTSNIANSYAFSQKRILLVDCDMRNPTVHRVLELPNRKGLADLIMAGREGLVAEDYIIHYAPYFDVLTAGHRPPNPTELLGSKRMKALINAFSEQYDYVILDTPPVLLVPDAIALHPYVDGILLVVRHGYTTKEVLEDCKKAWEVAGTKPSACILNAIPDMQKRYSYYGYYDYEETRPAKGRNKKSRRHTVIKQEERQEKDMYMSAAKETREAGSRKSAHNPPPAEKEFARKSDIAGQEFQRPVDRTKRKLH